MYAEAFRVARTQVRLYTSNRSLVSTADLVIEESRKADECGKCEDFLELGITAFSWLKKAEFRWLEGVQNGQYPFDPQVQERLDELYENWLAPCDLAERFIQEQIRRGFYPVNLDVFRSCCHEAREAVRVRQAESRLAETEQRRLAETSRTALQSWALENAP